jgi:hypothetical protein
MGELRDFPVYRNLIKYSCGRVYYKCSYKHGVSLLTICHIGSKQIHYFRVVYFKTKSGEITSTLLSVYSLHAQARTHK